MISRRRFLATGTLASLAIASSRSPLAIAESPSRLGVQLYVLREMLGKDFDGTLAKVAALGIKNVEFAGFYDRTAKTGSRHSRQFRPDCHWRALPAGQHV